MLDKFADELRQAREKSGLSLQQIAQKSRIDLKFIRAIDNGDFAFLPELYVKAFIKQYAKMVGLDEQLTIKKYESAKKGKPFDEPEEKSLPEIKKSKPEQGENKEAVKPVPAKVVKSFEESTVKEIESEQGNFFEKLKRDKILLSGVISGSAIVLFLIIYFLFLRSNSEIVVAEKPYEEIRQENQQRYVKEKTAAVPDNTGTAFRSDSLSLLIRASDTSWIKIGIDNGGAEEFKLFPLSSKVVKAASVFNLIVGNAGSTQLKLNNKDLNLSGKKNEVKYISIDKNGLKYLDNPPTFGQK